jgi:hypothetical protein
MNSRDEQLIAQCVARMLAGESAAIDRLPKPLRSRAYHAFREAVRDGKGDPNVHYGG